jgi:phage terminase large subunit GpA-like protein
VESGRWRRIFTTGPSQSGKTLLGSVIPLMYHLFEMRETVIYGVPSLDMVGDKWAEDILPAIAASQYRDLLPKSGRGSKGGTATRVQFLNGQTLRFMTAGGGDKSRAGFTSRVLIVTETDGFDIIGEASREADKLAQLEARLKSWGDRSRLYAECTVSLESGRTWQEYTKGTETRIACRCPHCSVFTTPERENLVGWKEAEDEMAAGENARVVCPKCGALWNEDDRRTANRNAVALHRGQTVDDSGRVAGELPRTNTLGFRWNALNNLLVSASYTAQGEWRASRSANEENAEKEQRQFVWAMPHLPTTIDLTSLDANSIAKRTEGETRGMCPANTKRITVGIDVGKWLCHWVALAWREHATPHIIDYGRIEVPSQELTQERAVLNALRQFRDDTLKNGWKVGGATLTPELVFIDTGDNDEAVYAFSSESGKWCWPIKGFGSTVKRMDKYVRKSRQQCLLIGDEYQAVQLPGKPKPLIEINVDHWKGWTHARLQTPMGQPGSMTVFASATPNEHIGLAKHFTAEKRVDEFVPGKGTVTRWVATNRNNHWLDAVTYACVAGHAAGERLFGETPRQEKTSIVIV